MCRRKPKTESEDIEPQRTENAAPQPSRRQKKKAKAIGIDLATPITGTDKLVHWTELEVLAQRIADNAQPEDIPDAALNILRDVVALRKKSFQFFTKSAQNSKDENLTQSNAAHAHIISVLERVLSKLEALARSGTGGQRRTEQKGDSKVSTNDLSNLFALLEVQTAPDDADAPDAASTDEPHDDTTVSEADAQSQKRGRKKAGRKTQKLRKPDKRTERAVVKSKKKPWIDTIDFGEIREVGNLELSTKKKKKKKKKQTK
jgi:hypothetical protein